MTASLFVDHRVAAMMAAWWITCAFLQVLVAAISLQCCREHQTGVADATE
jgi:hypothetical protein